MNEIRTFVFRMVGTSPILMHKFNGLAEEKILKERPEKEQAEKHGYRLSDLSDEGNMAMPCEWVRGALINAYVEHAPNKQKRTTKTHVSPRIRVEPVLLDLGTKIYEVDKRSAPAGNMSRGGVRDMVIRPAISKWQVTGKLTTTLDADVKDIKSMFELAGIDVGVGSNRPNGYGRFTVTEFSEVTK